MSSHPLSQMAAKPMPPERITYRVTPESEPEKAELQVDGPDRGKYKDVKTGALFSNNQDWIRSKNSKIPASSGGAG